MVKECIAFVAGLGVGAVCAKLYLDTKYKQQVDEEISAMREAFINKYESEKNVEDQDPDNVAENIINHSAPIRDDAKELKTKYHDIAGSYKEIVKNDPNNEPVIISEEEYSEADNKYAFESLDYYIDDGVIMSGEDEIGNAEEILGKENLNEFKNSEEETIYIKNDLFMIIYEVTKV